MTLAIIFSAASLILWGFSFVFFLGLLRRRTGAERILSELREDADAIKEEISAATDRNVLLVEDRIKSLKTLMEDVDRRAGALTRELDRRSVREIAYAELGKTIAFKYPQGEAAESAPPPSGAAAPVTGGEAEAGPEMAEPSVPRSPPNASKKSPAKQSFADKVTELHLAGFSPDLIAAHLGAPQAKVDLAIAMIKNRGQER
jgi:hypothetical protein